MASQLSRTPAIAASGAAAAFAVGWLVGHGVEGSDLRVVSGVVAIVNAYKSKVCITQDGSIEQWCGPLAVSGEEIAAGQHVTMVISPLKTVDGNTLEMGTVIPSRLGIAR